ncbi:MAG: hypothetical protein Q8L08_09390 [Candidatus Nanopelagicaceae bacterium]|nr:hypothetical protein [Candidatus Nanopelagicaceae bacterium]
MIVIIGLVILSISVLIAVMGFIVNSSNPFDGDFALFGQHMTGLTTGRLFLFGVIVGLVVALGLSILRGVFSRGIASRELQRELKKSRAETASVRADFERLSGEIAGERAKTQEIQTPSPDAVTTGNP